MDLSLNLFCEDENDDAYINVLRIRIKIRNSVAPLTYLSYKAIFCCLICLLFVYFIVFISIFSKYLMPFKSLACVSHSFQRIAILKGIHCCTFP